MKRQDARLRLAARLSLTSLFLFVALLLLSAALYPGGSWDDARADGFQPLVNYWCDLMRTQAMNGMPNETSAGLARISFAALAVSLLTYWPVAASGLGSSRPARWAIFTGTLSATCVGVLVWLPYNTRPTLHSMVTLAAGGCGFLAMTLVLAGSLRAATLLSARHACGAALLLAALFHIALYVDIVVRDHRVSPTLPVVQKVASLLLVLWMTLTLVARPHDAPTKGRERAGEGATRREGNTP